VIAISRLLVPCPPFEDGLLVAVALPPVPVAAVGRAVSLIVFMAREDDSLESGVFVDVGVGIDRCGDTLLPGGTRAAASAGSLTLYPFDSHKVMNFWSVTSAPLVCCVGIV